MSVGFVGNGGYTPVGTSVVVTGGGAKPEQTKEVTITENGTTNVTPDTGKVLTGVGITVDVPSDMKPEQTKEVTILANGTSTVTPDAGKVLTEVGITVNVPSGSAATHLYGWNCHEEYNGETRDYPMIFNYNTAKDTLADFEAGLSIDGAIYNDNNVTRQNMGLRDCSGWNLTGYTKLSSTSFQTIEPGIIRTFTLIDNIPVDQDITVNQSVDNVAHTIDVSQYSAPVEITPSNPEHTARKVTVTLDNIPSGADLEPNKAATIDVSQYSAPVEVTPTAGKDGMEKVTVTLDNLPKQWVPKSWSGLPADFGGVSGYNIWTDGTDIYYSGGSSYQYVLDKSTSTWSPKTWTGFTDFFGGAVWTDGTDIYFSSRSDQYVLNKATSTWSAKIWTGFTDISGSEIWTDGTDIYYSNGNDQYVLDKSTSTWSPKTWTGLDGYLYGSNVWTDGTDIYCQCNGYQYILDKSTSTWSQKPWASHDDEIYPANIWTDGENIYYSEGNKQYVFNKTTREWGNKVWAGINAFIGSDVWTDGTNMYVPFSDSYADYNYMLIGTYDIEIEPNKAATIDVSQYSAPVEVTPSADKNGMGKVTVALDNIPSTPQAVKNWVDAVWNESVDGTYIWTDGTDIYYSSGTNQFVLNKTTKQWESKAWPNGIMPSGANVWTDGTDIYSSIYDPSTSTNTQLVYDKTTGAWSNKTWNEPVNGQYIWTDGIDVYYSNPYGRYSGGSYSDVQLILNKVTGEWEPKTWDIYTTQPYDYIDGQEIWTDGENTYYSKGNVIQYIFNKTTKQWEQKTWPTNILPYGTGTWTDGIDIYYSSGSEKTYKLNKVTGAFEEVNVAPITSGKTRVWTDGTHTYYSHGYSHTHKVFSTSVPLNLFNFFYTYAPIFYIEGTPFLAVAEDGSLISALANVPNAKFLVCMSHGGSADTVYRKDSTSTILNNLNSLSYVDNQDFTITTYQGGGSSITLDGTSKGIWLGGIMFNNCMTSSGS